jgi:hypothetical protein
MRPVRNAYGVPYLQQGLPAAPPPPYNHPGNTNMRVRPVGDLPLPMAQGQSWVQFAPGYGNGVLLMHPPVYVAPWMGYAMPQHQYVQQALHNHNHHDQHQHQWPASPADVERVTFQQIPACPPALPPAECGGAMEELPNEDSEREGSLLSDPAIAAWGSRGSSRGGSKEQPGEDVGASIPATVVRPGETNEEAEQRRSAFSSLLRGSALVPSVNAGVPAVCEEEEEEEEEVGGAEAAPKERPLVFDAAAAKAELDSRWLAAMGEAQSLASAPVPALSRPATDGVAPLADPACPPALPPTERDGVAEVRASPFEDPAIAWSSRPSSQGGSEVGSGEEEGGASIPATVVRPGETNEEAEQRRSAFTLLLRGSAQVPSAAVAVAAVHEVKAARAAVPAAKAAPAHMHRSGACSQRPWLVRAPLFVSAMR